MSPYPEAPLTAAERDEWLILTIVRAVNRIQIRRARFAGFCKIYTTPAKIGFVALASNGVDGKSRVATIPIRKQMNLHQTVMKAHRKFVKTVRLVVSPVTSII